MTFDTASAKVGTTKWNKNDLLWRKVLWKYENPWNDFLPQSYRKFLKKIAGVQAARWSPPWTWGGGARATPSPTSTCPSAPPWTTPGCSWWCSAVLTSHISTSGSALISQVIALRCLGVVRWHRQKICQFAMPWCCSIRSPNPLHATGWYSISSFLSIRLCGFTAFLFFV